MSRTKRLIDGILLSYCYQGLVMLVGLWLTPFLLHRLGQHNYGIWLVGLQSLTYLSLLDLGVIGLLPREVAFLSGRMQRGEDPQLVRTLLEENACVIICQTPLLIAALAVSFLFFRTLDPAVHGVLAIIFLTYGAQFPFRIYYAALEGLQDFAFLGYLQMGAWLVGVAANVSLVFFGRGLYSLAIGWSLSQTMVTIGCIVRMYARHRSLTPRRIQWLRWVHLFRYLRAGFWVSVTQITQMLIKGSDVLLLAGLDGPSAVVPYSCSIKLTNVLANQPQVILQAAQPGLTQLRATADHSHISQVIGSLSQAMLMLSGGVACVVIAINGGFVRHWVGANQYLGFIFTVLIAFSMLARHWNTSTIYTLFCFGKERYISIIGLIDGGCFVLLMYLLVRRWGVIGIPIASAASACLISLPCNIRVLSQVTSVSWWEQITPIRKWFVPFAFAASFAWAANFLIKPSTYHACAFTAFVVLAIYAALEFRVIHQSIWGNRLKELLEAGWHRVSQLIWPDSTPSVVIEPALTAKGKIDR